MAAFIRDIDSPLAYLHPLSPAGPHRWHDVDPKLEGHRLRAGCT